MQLMRDLDHEVLDVHQCAFGSHWRKSTRLLFVYATQDVLDLRNSLHRVRCHGRHGWCSHRPGHKHVHLEGALTTSAAAYPPRLARFLADCLVPRP